MPILRRVMMAIACGSLAAALHHPASATAILDQSDTINSGFVGASVIGQSFTAGVSGQLASIFLASPYASSTSGADTVSLYRGDGNFSASALLATGLITPGVTAAGYTFNTAALMVSLVAGQQYTFDLTAASGQTLYADGDMTGSYMRGQLYYANVPYSSYDLTFNTVVNVAQSAAVPEPASLTLFGFAMVAMHTVRRRRQHPTGA